MQHKIYMYIVFYLFIYFVGNQPPVNEKVRKNKITPLTSSEESLDWSFKMQENMSWECICVKHTSIEIFADKAVSRLLRLQQL